MCNDDEYGSKNVAKNSFKLNGVYSRIPITRTFKGNRKQFELSGVRVIEGKII